jgi:hypothetical protein
LKSGQLLTTWRTKSGVRKANKGKLPLSHPQWQKLADHNHRMHCLAGMAYKLVRLPMSKSLVTTADTEQLKRNECYIVHEYKSYDFETFKQMVWTVFYHHFGCHGTCGVWCPWLRHKYNPEELKKLFYCDKIKDVALYDQILEIWKMYCSDEALLCDIHRKWHMNKCESMNKCISKFVLKTIMHLYMSIVGQVHIYLAVALDSVGYEEYYRTLFDMLGLCSDDTFCGMSHRHLDTKKKYERTYYKKMEVCRARCKQ